MEIVAEFSFNNGREFIEEHHKLELLDVREIISSVDASRLRQR